MVLGVLQKSKIICTKNISNVGQYIIIKNLNYMEIG